VKAWNAHDDDAVLRHFCDDVVFRAAPHPGPTAPTCRARDFH